MSDSQCILDVIKGYINEAESAEAIVFDLSQWYEDVDTYNYRNDLDENGMLYGIHEVINALKRGESGNIKCFITEYLDEMEEDCDAYVEGIALIDRVNDFVNNITADKEAT